MISYLDYLASLPQVSRGIYGYDENDKPNDHCVWSMVGYSILKMAWVETDEHLRQRIKELTNEKV